MPCVGEHVVAPAEEYIAGSYGINWGKVLRPTNDTVSAITITVLDEAGDDVTSDIAPDPGVIDAEGEKTTCKLTGFESQATYKVFHSIETTNGNKLNDYLLIRCTDQ